MSGLYDKIELARKSGYSDGEILAHLSTTDLAPKIKQAQEAGYGEAEIVGYLGERPKRSLPAELGRQVGLTVRAGVQGLASLPGMLANIPAAIYNTGADLYDEHRSPSVGELVTGKQKGFRFPDQTQFGARVSDLARLPDAENATERVVGDVAGAMAGQGALMKAGQGATGWVRDLLTSRPGSQLVGAAGGAGAAGATREGGGGPVAQTVAGFAGGIVAPVSADVAKTTVGAAYRGTKAAIDPFTASGREKVVGSTIKRLATDPKRAAENLEQASETVPGSSPTTAQAARDEGLLIAERGVASSNPRAGAQLARRASEQNQARNLLLSSMAGDDASIAAARTARDEAAAPLRYAALSDSGIVGVSTEKLLRQLRAQESQPGIRSSDVQAGVIGAIKEKITKFTDEDGFINPNDLYTIRKEIGSTIAKFSQENQSWDKRRASGLTDNIQSWIDDSIEAAGGKEWKKYLSTYAEKSKPINQMETLQEIKGKVLNAGTDAATGERVMSAVKFYNAVTKNKAELSKVLTKEQMGNLEAIGKDLDAAALSASSGKAAGSNTTQNISTAYVIGSALGNKSATNALVQNLSRPLNWLNKLNEQQIQDLLVDAMLDPALARSLMGKATGRAVESVGFELKQRAIAKGFGGLVGSSAPAKQPQSEEPATQ